MSIGHGPDQYEDRTAKQLGVTNGMVAILKDESLEPQEQDRLVAKVSPDPKSWKDYQRAYPDPKKKVAKVSGRNYVERDFQSDFGKFIREKGTKSGVYELKVTPTDSLPFDALKEHQRDALLKASGDKLYHRLSDTQNFMASQGKGTFQQQPFDSLLLVGIPAWVVIMFNSKKRANKVFYMLTVQDFLDEERRSERKSLTEDRAGEIGYRCQLL